MKARTPRDRPIRFGGPTADTESVRPAGGNDRRERRGAISPALMQFSTTSDLLYRENGRFTADDFLAMDREIELEFPLLQSPSGCPILYILASNVDGAADLIIHVNGRAHAVKGARPPFSGWLRHELPEDLRRPGLNSIRIGPQSGWRICREPASGNYAMRLRLTPPIHQRQDVSPLYTDPFIEMRPDEWLALLPESLRSGGPRWPWCWNLAGFLSQAWRYRNNQDGTSYAPWDARVILPWGRRGTDDHGRPAIVMCVHYAVCFVQFCIAMGLPARAVVLASGLNSDNGHFVAEVWLDEFQTWAMIDPNLHLCFRDPRTGRPFAAGELASLADATVQHGGIPEQPLASLAEFGEGFEFQRARLGAFAEEECLTGNVYHLWGVWGRHDWAARPDLAPPAHGSIPYAETDIVWCATNETVVSTLGMFPHFLTPRQLALAPSSLPALSTL